MCAYVCMCVCVGVCMCAHVVCIPTQLSSVGRSSMFTGKHRMQVMFQLFLNLSTALEQTHKCYRRADGK